MDGNIDSNHTLRRIFLYRAENTYSHTAMRSALRRQSGCRPSICEKDYRCSAKATGLWSSIKVGSDWEISNLDVVEGDIVRERTE